MILLRGSKVHVDMSQITDADYREGGRQYWTAMVIVIVIQ